MSDYSAVAPPQNFNKSQAFAAALQRAKQIAAKINPAGATAEAGTKRPIEDGTEGLIGEPDSKKAARQASPPRMAQTTVTAGTTVVNTTPGLPASLVTPGVPGGPVTSEDIKVPDKMVGLSRGGEQITRLQSESGCKIQMAPDSGGLPDRICTLTGNASSISRAKELINQIVHQRYKTEGPGGGPLERGGEMMPPTHTNPSFVEVMIPGPKVGLIIGKGGETIKTLQEKSGAKMVVIQDGPNQEAEKPLRITGDPQKVEHAKTLVYELLAEKENQRREQQVGGRPGSQGGMRAGFGAGPRPGGPGFGRGGEESTYVVPANKCGVIIGRGGETIKQINQQTGAHCELDRRPGNNPTEKVFIIRGTPEQIESAKQMIAEKLGNLNPHGGPGGQGGPGMGPSANGYPGPGGAPGAGGPPQYGQAWGAPTPYQQPYHNQMDPSQSRWGMGVSADGSGGAPMGSQPDYSAQWIQYYRSLGMHQEADAIEAQTKAKAVAAAAAAGGGGGGGGGTPGSGQAQAGQQNGAPQTVAAPASSGGGQPDYSAQWAQYYRSIGKIKEAELIEHQMKAKQQQGVGGGGSGGPQSTPGFPSAQPTAATAPQAGAAPGGYYPGPQAPGGFYSTPQGYQYPGQPQPQPPYQPYQPQQPQDAQVP